MPPASSDAPLVLLTGGAGFIGSRTARALTRRGYRVRILDVLDPQIHGSAASFPRELADDFDCRHGDVRNPDDVRRALDGVSYVFHFAALTGVGQSMYDITRYVDVNIGGTARLIETIAAHAPGVRRLVLASSRAVYGEGTHACPECGPVYPGVRRREDLQRGMFHVLCPKCGRQTTFSSTQEDRPLTPVSIYGWTKREQEELFRYAQSTLGISSVILRYFNVYGAGQSLKNPYTGIVTIFMNRLKAGAPIAIYERGMPVRDFVHIDDVVAANLLTLDADATADLPINVGTGIPLTIRDAAEAIGRATGLTPRYEDRGEYRVGDIHTCVADCTRAKTVLGYTPSVMLEAGINSFVAWAIQEPSTDEYTKTVEELEARGLFGRARR